MTKMINNDPEWEMHPTEGPIGMTSAEKILKNIAI
jgi:hypothetical protein